MIDPTGRLNYCCCCGGRKFSEGAVLWKELIQEWQISAKEVAYINRQQGMKCQSCGSNLRSICLAYAVMRCFGFDGTFSTFVESAGASKLKVLEVNEAGALTPFLRKLPSHIFGSYPEMDMTALKFENDQFDLVIHSDTLEHVPNPSRALSECCRVLRPGGFCAYTIPIIVGRLSRGRSGLPMSFHGNPKERGGDWAVQTEYGADAWRDVIEAGFSECRIISVEHPTTYTLVGAK